jgi:hypothetical protein
MIRFVGPARKRDQKGVDDFAYTYVLECDASESFSSRQDLDAAI